MVLEDCSDSGLVRRQRGEVCLRSHEGLGVRRKEREAAHVLVKHLKQCLVGRRVGAGVEYGDGDLRECSLDAEQRLIGVRDGLGEGQGDVQDMVNHIDGDVGVCERVRDDRIVAIG